VTIPLLADDGVFGALAFGAIAAPHRWTDEEITGLQLVARIFASLLCRQRAEQRAEQLRAELARASRATMLGELAAALAHELNQPLTAILGNAQAARRFIANGSMDPVELLQILDDIINADKRASSLIHNLRMLMEGASAPPTNCCLNALLSEVCDFMGTELTNNRVRLERNYGAPLILVRVVKAEIQQVLANLISNAAQAMGGTPADQRIIRIETGIEGRQARVRVIDRGCGFPANRAEMLFEPFHSTKPNGLGMGLAICRRIIAAHHGAITATNHEGGGAAFSFTLPHNG
jgi:C4-dicarboxylate-specific signal transduction histidine kinase